MKCRKDALGRICGGKKRGECVKHSSQGKTVCKCKKGFLGKDCGVTCPRLGEGDVCSGKGTCFMDSKTKKAKCVCKKGHTGDKCHQHCPANKNGDVRNCQGKECQMQVHGWLHWEQLRSQLPWQRCIER